MKKLLLILALTLFEMAYLLWWESVTLAVFDVDAPEQWLFATNQAIELFKNHHSLADIYSSLDFGAYPKGYAIYLLSMLQIGFAGLLTSSKLWLGFPLLLLLNSLLLFDCRRSCLSFALLVFFFPITQLMLRSMSLHSLLILVQTCSFLALYKAKLYRANWLGYFGLTLLFIGASFKHLGLLHLLLAIPFLCSDIFSWLFQSIATGILIYFFYGFEYISITLDHNPWLNDYFLIVSILGFCCFLIFLKFIHRKPFPVCNYHWSLPWIALLLSIEAYTAFLIIHDWHNEWSQFMIPSAIAILWIVPLLLFRRSLNPLNSYLFLVVCICSFLFFSSMGFLHSVFWFPALLLLLLSQESVQKRKQLLPVLSAVSLIWIHYYPQLLSYFRGNIEQRRDSQIFLMNSAHQNYWSLEQTEIGSLLRKLPSFLSSVSMEPGEENLALISRIDQFQSFVFNQRVPVNRGEEQISLVVNAQIPGDIWDKWELLIEEVGVEQALFKILESGEVKLLIIPRKNLARFQPSLYPADDTVWDEIKTRFLENPRGENPSFYFQNFADLTCAYLRSKPSLQGRYWRIEIDSSNFELWVHKE